MRRRSSSAAARARLKDRHLRRARRRAEQRRVLRRTWARLRLVLALSRSDRAAGRGASGHRRADVARLSRRGCAARLRFGAETACLANVDIVAAHEELAPVGLAAELRDEVGDFARVDDVAPGPSDPDRSLLRRCRTAGGAAAATARRPRRLRRRSAARRAPHRRLRRRAGRARR